MPLAAATAATQFVDVAGRRVLVRYAGTGPALMLLHQSPQTSRTMLPWIERLADRYAVFAPDTPGFGFSDPLPLAQPTIPDYAAALNDLLGALNIERCLVYGVHTGAVTALRLALDHPERIAGLVCDGYARFNADERQQLLNGYLPPFEPEWNGGHLLWLWSRFREQLLYFPWNTPTADARINYAAPTTEKLHTDSQDLLDAGDAYRVGYRAPFLYDDPTAASRLTVDGKIFYRAEDVLVAHLPRLKHLPASITASRIEGGPTELARQSDAFFLSRATAASVVDGADAVSRIVSKSRRVIETTHGSLSVLLAKNGGDFLNGIVELHLHDLGQAATIPVDVAHGIAVVAPELPLHGASRDWPSGAVAPTEIAVAIVEALAQLGVTQVRIRAVGGSGALAAAIADWCQDQGSIRCERIRLINPLPLSDHERAQFLSLLPDATPQSSGGHLVAAWNWARMKYLFWPWLPQTGAAVRAVAAPAPARLHAETREIIRVGTQLMPMWRAALDVDLAAALSNVDGSVVVEHDDEPERHRMLEPFAHALSLTLVSDDQTFIPGVRIWQT